AAPHPSWCERRPRLPFRTWDVSAAGDFPFRTGPQRTLQPSACESPGPRSLRNRKPTARFRQRDDGARPESTRVDSSAVAVDGPPSSRALRLAPTSYALAMLSLRSSDHRRDLRRYLDGCIWSVTWRAAGWRRRYPVVRLPRFKRLAAIDPPARRSKECDAS